MGKTTRQYEEALDAIMQFIDERLTEKNVRVKVRTQQDLRKYFKLADNYRRKNAKGHQGKPKMSPSFINELVRFQKAQALIGHSLGSSIGATLKFRDDRPPREDGRERVPYERLGRYGFALKEPHATKRGNVRIVYRDEETNKPVSKAYINAYRKEEEEE